MFTNLLVAISDAILKRRMKKLFTDLCKEHDLPLPKLIGFSEDLCFISASGVQLIMGYTDFNDSVITFNLLKIFACDKNKDPRIKDIYEYVVRHEFRHWWQINVIGRELVTNLYALQSIEYDAEAYGIGIAQEADKVSNDIKSSITKNIA